MLQLSYSGKAAGLSSLSNPSRFLFCSHHSQDKWYAPIFPAGVACAGFQQISHVFLHPCCWQPCWGWCACHPVLQKLRQASSLHRLALCCHRGNCPRRIVSLLQGQFAQHSKHTLSCALQGGVKHCSRNEMCQLFLACNTQRASSFTAAIASNSCVLRRLAEETSNALKPTGSWTGTVDARIVNSGLED